jgi:hypothetical protein
MDEKAETKALEQWVRKLDRPLPTKHGSKRRRKAKRQIKQ